MHIDIWGASNRKKSHSTKKFGMYGLRCAYYLKFFFWKFCFSFELWPKNEKKKMFWPFDQITAWKLMSLILYICTLILFEKCGLWTYFKHDFVQISSGIIRSGKQYENTELKPQKWEYIEEKSVLCKKKKRNLKLHNKKTAQIF